MRHLFISLVLLLFAFPAVAQDKTDGVQFPSIAIPPAPAPAQVTKLTANQLYVITSDVPCFVLASPLGLVSINEDAGPIKIRGSFVDGKGIETRTYRQKQVVLIEATGTGTVEILVVIVNKTKAEDVLRKTLDVDIGVGPMPPPGPDPKPPTPPTPNPDAALVAILQAGFAKDTDTDKAASVAKLAAVYRNAAKVTASDSSFKTVKNLDDALRFASQGAIGVLSIPNTRDAVGGWLKSQLPTAASASLDDQTRQRFIAAWTAIGEALDKVK